MESDQLGRKARQRPQAELGREQIHLAPDPVGLQFGYLLGGSILVGTVFTWPGSGFLLSKAIINRDVPVLQGTILTLSLVFVATNLIVDLLQSLIDPRIRRG